MLSGIAGISLATEVHAGGAGGGCRSIAKSRATDTGCPRAEKRNRRASARGIASRTLEGSKCPMRSVEQEKDIGTVGDTPATTATAGNIDIVDSNSV